MPDDTRERLIARVLGQVQGVGYRYFAIDEANRLGLSGYVRNMSDGSVEVLAEGPRNVLEGFLAILRRGPSAARVTDMKYSFVPATGEFRDFHIRPWT